MLDARKEGFDHPEAGSGYRPILHRIRSANHDIGGASQAHWNKSFKIF
jgi:hypothetical protein